MGDPKKTRKQFKRPLKIWDKTNIEKEKKLKKGFGLKNKREIWKTETVLRKKRHSARKMLAMPMEERLKREKDLLGSFSRMGIMTPNGTLDDVLTLTVESFLERRLQTLAWRKGLANTPTQARQFITHGHIAIGGQRVTAPGYMVTAEEEGKIGYYGGKKMVLKPAEDQKKKDAKKEFEEAKPREEKQAEAAPQMNAQDAMKAVREAREKATAEGKQGKPEEKASSEKEGKEQAGETKEPVDKKEKATEGKQSKEGKKENMDEEAKEGKGEEKK